MADTDRQPPASDFVVIHARITPELRDIIDQVAKEHHVTRQVVVEWGLLYAFTDWQPAIGQLLTERPR